MPKKITGTRAFSYLGVNASTPPNIVFINREPNNTDYVGFNLGDLWVNNESATQTPPTPPKSSDVWILTSKDKRLAQASWQRMSGVALNHLTGDTGGAIFPDNNGNINLLGGSGITVTGNPVNNTLTIDGSALTGLETLSGDGNVQVTADNGNIKILGSATVAVTEGSHELTITTKNLPEYVDGIKTDDNNTAVKDGNNDILLHGENNIVTTSAGSTATVGLSQGTDGQVLIGRTGNNAQWNTLKSSDNSVTITNTPNAIDLKSAVGYGVQTLSDGVTQVSPSAGNIELEAGTGISIASDAPNNKLIITNSGAVPGGVIETINTISPDNNNDFTIDAGSNITITPGSNKITISADDLQGIQTINNTSPDGSGNFDIVGGNNVTVTTGTNQITIDATDAVGMETLNGVSPDGSGDFTIDAGSNITITPGANKITISADDLQGIQTINNESPDGSGDFDIVGGNNVTVTTGTNQITIDATDAVGMETLNGVSPDNGNVALTSSDSSVTITNGTNSIDLKATSGGSGGGNHYFFAYRSSNGGNTPISNSFKKEKMTHVLYNDNNVYNLSSGLYTAPEDGIYMFDITYNIHLSNTDAGAEVGIKASNNSTMYVTGTTKSREFSGFSATKVIKLSQGNTVYGALRVGASGGGTYYVQGIVHNAYQTSFSGCKIG